MSSHPLNWMDIAMASTASPYLGELARRVADLEARQSTTDAVLAKLSAVAAKQAAATESPWPVGKKATVAELSGRWNVSRSTIEKVLKRCPEAVEFVMRRKRIDVAKFEKALPKELAKWDQAKDGKDQKDQRTPRRGTRPTRARLLAQGGYR